MTGRERILTTLNNREPDVFPIDFGGHRSSGIMAIAYAKLRDYLGLPKKPIRVYDFVQQLAYIDEDVLDLFHSDTRDVSRAFSENSSMWKDWVLPDGTECLIPSYVDIRKDGNTWYLYSPVGEKIGIQKEGMLYVEQIFWPWKGNIPDDISMLRETNGRHMWSVSIPPYMPETSESDWIQGVSEYRENTDKAMVYIFGGSFFEVSCYIYGIEDFMISMALEPEKVHRHLDGLLDIYLEDAEKFYRPIAPYVDVIVVGDDLGMQSGPQMSLAMYQEFFKGRQEILWKRFKELGSARINLHSCGSIKVFLPDLMDNGLDTLNPVQILAADMNATGLKNLVQGRLTLWGGGCDTQNVLSNGSTDEIRKHVREQVGILAPGGNFVFQQVHNIMADVPPENIFAMFQEANRLRGIEIPNP